MGEIRGITIDNKIHQIFSLRLELDAGETPVGGKEVLDWIYEVPPPGVVDKFPATVFVLGRKTGGYYINAEGGQTPTFAELSYINLFRIDSASGSLLVLYKYPNDDGIRSETEALSIAQLLGKNRLLIDKNDGPKRSYEESTEGPLEWLEFGKSCIYTIFDELNGLTADSLVHIFAEVFPDLPGHSIIDSHRTWNTIKDRRGQTLFAYDLTHLRSEIKFAGPKYVMLNQLWEKCKDYLLYMGYVDINLLIAKPELSAKLGILVWSAKTDEYDEEESFAKMLSIFEQTEVNLTYSLPDYPINKTRINSPAIFTADFIRGFKNWLENNS